MALADWALEAMQLENNGKGRRRGARGLTVEENEDGDGSGTADRVEGLTADLGVLRCGSCSFCVLDECENGAGEAAERVAMGLDLLL